MTSLTTARPIRTAESRSSILSSARARFFNGALSPIHIGMLLLIGVLTIVVEGLIAHDYLKQEKTTAAFEESVLHIANLANMQRETLLLKEEARQYIDNPAGSPEAANMRRALLGNQLRIEQVHAAKEPKTAEAAAAIQQSLQDYDALWIQLSTAGTPIGRSKAGTDLLASLAETERQVKRLYDRHELGFFNAASANLNSQRHAQLLLLITSGLVILLNAFVIISLGSSVRRLKAGMVEQRQAEERLRQANEQLVEAQDHLVRAEKLAVIGQLAGGVAHDLRNPLGAINNAVYYINKRLGASELAQANPRIMQFLRIMEEEIGHANQIISDLMTFARVKAPMMSITNLNEQVEQSLAHLEGREGIRIIKELSFALPPIMADAEQLQRVFINLASNAQDAMPEGGELTIKTREANGHVEVEFTDTGHGIPQEIIQKIFDPLFTTKTKGTGLGLAICQQIVAKHDGVIEVESKAGQGTRFIIRLPRQFYSD